MSYESIFNTKPKREDKEAFCKRITKLLNSIYYDSGNGYIETGGLDLLNKIFIHSKFNKGYHDIDDLIKSYNSSYDTIFTLVGKKDCYIDETNIIVNIEIIINCLTYHSLNDQDLYYYPGEAANTIKIIFDAVKEYLLACGYKVYKDNKNKILKIVPIEISVNVNELNDDIEKDVLSYYDFKNQNNRVEKKRILRDIIDRLEPRRNEIKTKFGKHIDNAYGSFSNNFDIRHNNVTIGDSNYKETIADLTDEEMIKWYDYMYSFMLNIYINIDKVRNVNIDNQFKR